MFYFFMFLENVNNLAYYKDVVFCAFVVYEFSGMLYYAKDVNIKDQNRGNLV